MRRIGTLVVAVVALTAVTGLGVASAGGQPFTTELTGEAEVPITGDLDGTGTAHVTINRGLGEVCWSIQVEDIVLPAILAHIHEAPVGVPGDIVVHLTPPDASGSSSGCTIVDRELARDIAKNPAEYYVNVHTTDFQGGALRGQLG